MTPLLLIEDTPSLQMVYESVLRDAGHEVVSALTAADGLRMFARHKPQVVLLDLMLPDRPGNNRIDTLKNIVRDPRVSLLFLVPGAGETIRVNGTAEISIDPNLLDQFQIHGKTPRSVMLISIERMYFQCQKALKRSRLWDPDSWIDRATLPSAGDFLQARDSDFDGATYDREYPERMKRVMY